MTPTICTVSGTILSLNGTPLSGVTIIATLARPFIYSATGDLIPNSIQSTSSGADGTWSLSLIETTTDMLSVTFAFVYPQAGGATNQRYEYTAIIPDQPTANFSDIAVNNNQ